MIRIVTDSTADIPAELAEEHGIIVVPAIVNFGMETFREGSDITRAQFYSKLVSSPHFPTTSQPSAGEFAEAYVQASREGHKVLSIHLGAAFSGLFGAAQLAADMNPHIPVTLFDTGLLSMGTGLLVLQAAEAAQRGASLEEILEMLKSMRKRTHVVAALDTVEFLRRGGRITSLNAALARILSIRPVIHVHGGQLHQLARTRHRQRSLRRVVDIAKTFAPFSRIVVLHTAALQEAASVAERISHLNSGVKPAIIEAGSVIGTHTGPGAVGFACATSQ